MARDRAKRKVLVADDDLYYREMIASLLERMGYAFVMVRNGTSALRMMLEGDDLDLAILDVFMEELSGIEVLEQFQRAVELNGVTPFPVIVMTADCSPETELKARLAGANVFLLKPFTTEVLAESVAQLIDCAQAARV